MANAEAVLKDHANLHQEANMSGRLAEVAAVQKSKFRTSSGSSISSASRRSCAKR